MRVRRGLLFWGLFLIPLGAVPLLVRAGVVDAATVARAWRLWPVILIALGLAIVAGRSQLAVIGTAVTAVILGLAAGGALATGSPWFGVLGDCANGRDVTSHEDQTGTFTSTATVRLDLSCGDFQLATQGGSDWALHADFNGPPPVVAAAPNALEVTSPTSGNGRRQSWNVKVPSSANRRSRRRHHHQRDGGRRCLRPDDRRRVRDDRQDRRDDECGPLPNHARPGSRQRKPLGQRRCHRPVRPGRFAVADPPHGPAHVRPQPRRSRPREERRNVDEIGH